MTSSASDQLYSEDSTESAVDGESLEDILRTGPIADSRLLDIAVQITAALAPNHAAGLIHGRLTASEILLDHNGRANLRNLNRCAPGSPQEDQADLGQILKIALERASHVCDPLRWTVDRLLAQNPDDRYTSTRDLYLDLRTIRDRLLEPSPPLSPPANWTTAQPTRDRRPFIAVPLTLISCAIFTYFLVNHAPLPKRGQLPFQSFPVWSQDGRKILFVKSVDGVDQVFVASSESGPIQLTNSPQPNTNPRWSSDGTAVSFDRSGRSWTIPSTNP